MTARPEANDIARQWLAKASDDFLAARHLLTDTDSWAYGSVCYHAQQCTEKAVKAILSARGIHFPKTHDITELVALLPPDIEVGLAPDVQDLLTDYAMTTRYPGDMEPLTHEDAESATVQANTALSSAKRLIADLGTTDASEPALA